MADAAKTRLGWPLGYLLAALLLVVYLSWQAFDWLPFEHAVAGDAVGAPLGFLATFAAWRASRLAAAVPHLRRAWTWVALALAGQAAGSVAQLAYEATASEPGYPSISDPFYLSFYPLMLIGVLSFLQLRRGRGRRLELALDCAIVGLGGAAFAFFVLGPELLEGVTALEAIVTLAYPVGDIVLLVALAAAVMTDPLPGNRPIFAWMAAAMGLFILGDLIFGNLVLHGEFEGGSLVEFCYEVAFVCFVVAAGEQRRLEPGAAPAAARGVAARAGWLPYLAIAAAIAVLLNEELSHAVFPDLAITLIAASVFVLVVVRQLLAMARLRQSRAHLDEAQELAQLGSWDWDVEQDVIYVSDQEARLLGAPPGSTLTLAEVAEMVHPDDRELLGELTDRALGDGRPFSYDIRFVRPGGRSAPSSPGSSRSARKAR